jgi:membrane protein implicated in regulation of membrane protease activity
VPPAANSPQAVGTPGFVLICVGVSAFVLCVVAYAMTSIDLGTWAGIVALISSAAGWALLSAEGRRQRGSQPIRTGTGRDTKPA